MKTVMTMTSRKLFALFVLLILVKISYSQENDFGIWLGANAEYKPIKNLEAGLSGSIRTFNNTSQIEQAFVEGGLQYRFIKNFYIFGSYRLISNREDNSKYYFRHKLFLGIKAICPYNNFLFSGSVKLQRVTRTYIEDAEDLLSKYYGRIKLKAEYDIPSFPMTPFLYAESFSPMFSGSGFEISKYRLSSGIEIKLTGKSSFETGYIFQRDYHPAKSDEHIISVNYKFKF
jgi:hypothetical protein